MEAGGSCKQCIISLSPKMWKVSYFWPEHIQATIQAYYKKLWFFLSLLLISILILSQELIDAFDIRETMIQPPQKQNE